MCVCVCVCVCVCMCVCLCMCVHPHLSGAQVHKELQDLYAGLHSGGCLESRANGILHHHLQVLDARTEAVVAVVPGGGLHVQDAVSHAAQRREVLVKRGLNLLQALDNGGPRDTSKRRHRSPLPLRAVTKVNLALTDVQQVLAALHEGVHLSKDAEVVQHPLLPGELGVHPPQVLIGALPGGTAGDALMQNRSAALHKALKDVIK